MSQKRILFIDDEPHEVSSIRDALEYEQYEVILATNGEEAFEKIKSGHFNLVILDIIMPSEGEKPDPANARTTGVRVGQAIREVFPRIPIICLSVVTDRRVQNQIKELGLSFYIEKPALPSKVLEEVKFWLNQA